MATKCEKCGTKQILMTGAIYAHPDEEPYESGVFESVEIESVEIGVYFEYCPECQRHDDIYTNQL